MSLLTKSGGILGPIATVLGYIMSGIFAVLVAIHIPNIGLSIVLFTIVIYMLMLPLTYRQQKFSRMTPLMNPELNAIREKYKGKNDQATMQRMNEETQQVYAKYGVNPAGSCVQLVVQMLILFPLYRVIMNIPAYVPQVKKVFVHRCAGMAFDRFVICEIIPQYLRGFIPVVHEAHLISGREYSREDTDLSMRKSTNI